MKYRYVLFVFCMFCMLQSLHPMDRYISFDYSINWDSFELKADARLDFTAAGLQLPGGRAQAEELVDMEFPRMARPFLLSLPVDSSTELETHINQGLYSLQTLDNTIAAAQKSAPTLTRDLQKLSVSYMIDLNGIVASLIRHTHASPIPRTLIPTASRPYTGIIIFADKALPVHGRAGTSRTEACLFPKIWDSEMNLIYERNMVDPVIARERGIVRYASEEQVLGDTPSGITPQLQELVGNDPMRILARSLFGIRTTDIVIDRDDALALISMEENRQLLREGRLVIVMDLDQ